MTANNQQHSNTRNAKRKADSPEEEEPLTRPQRKKQKQQQQQHRGQDSEASSPSLSPVAARQTGSVSALQKHFRGLYDEIINAADNEYVSLPRFVVEVMGCLGIAVSDGSGRAIASDFMKLPPKKRYPDYYVTIKKPIALDTISSRIEKEEYDDTEALKADLTLMTTNAKKYNQKGSSIYEDAVAIQVSSAVS